MLAGHVDEIGVIVSHIDENGFIWFKALGGWDAQVLVGQRQRFKGSKGEVRGVVGRKAIHLLEPDERDKAVKLKNLWADIGAKAAIPVPMPTRLPWYAKVSLLRSFLCPIAICTAHQR